MLNILSIFMYILSQLKRNDPRFIKKDHEHLIDTKTGVEFHLYEDYFKITRNGEEIISNQYLTPDEQSVIWKIRELMQDPEETKKRMENHPALIKSKRLHLSELYSNPTPIISKPAVSAEKDAKEYAG